MPTLLLVEDDAKLADLTVSFLENHGYAVHTARTGPAGVQRTLELRPDLVLLDLMLPGLDGLEVCRQVRAAGFARPLIMLTARGDPLDEILGLRSGADDYLRKPVRPQVLLARIQAMLRRITVDESRRDLGWMVLDLGSRGVTVDGHAVRLTTAEFDLLLVLARHAGTAVTRDVLSEELRGIPWDGLDRSIDLRVSRVRRKLGDEDGERLKSVRGVGYLLVPKA